MELSILIGALGFFAYNLLAPVMQIKLDGKAVHYPVNQYFGSELKSRIDFSRVDIKADLYGTFSINQREVITFCGESHWKKVNNQRTIH
ncbi:hypothetical protein ACFL4D_02445 [Candidatus Margulisiibacteriota bacterium]